MSTNRIKTKPAVGGGGQGRGAQGKASRVYFSTTGKPVARLEGHILRKRVRASLHQLRRPPAWAVDQAVLEAARWDGAQVVEISDIESRRRYTAPLTAFDLHGFRFDRGFGVQIGLPLNYWRVEAAGVRQLSLLEV
jgi:hypothetical protein